MATDLNRERPGRISGSRAHETRAATRHDIADDYTPSTLLQTPPAKTGFRLRWVREFASAGVRDTLNLSRRTQDGYYPVKAEDYPEHALGATGAEPIRRGPLVLMEIPEARAAAREAYYRRQTRRQMEATDHLQGIRAADRLPFVRDRDTTEVIAGGRRIADAPD